MKSCDNCHVDVLVPRTHCPLCAGALHEHEDSVVDAAQSTQEIFPPIPTLYTQYNFFFRVLIFISVAGAAICVFINILTPGEGFWSLIVLLGIAYMWITILTGIQRLSRVSRVILYQMVVLCLISYAIDYLYGQHGWAIDFVVPSLCVFAMFAIMIIARVSKLGLEDVGIYIVVNSLLGIVPLVFVLTGQAGIQWPSLSCVLISVLSLAGMFIIGGNEMFQEAKKRFHI